MTSPKLFFYLTYLFFGKIALTTEQKSSSIHQKNGFVLVHVGDSLNLSCNCKRSVANYYWYKQTLGQKPKLISSFIYKSVSFHGECENNTRFTLDTENDNIDLKISDLHISDSATYYCARKFAAKFEFGDGIFVSVKGSSVNDTALVHQSASETIQPGGSVTPKCTVHTGTCDEEHSVYWFKNSEESHPGLIYTHGGRNDQCERDPNTQTHTCVYNLPMESLNLSHAGTYYCAVASCGHILFGVRTKLDSEKDEDSLLLVYFLSGALAFTTILSLLLAVSLCIIRKRNSCHCKASATANAEASTNEDDLHYATLSVNKASRARRQRDATEDECVYSRIKH
ncbi:immunoglobulin kappa light chain-like [Chaetodon auriga]|uniref:immunoglobulin kappa light chain-like n=1 Tax=Chaetodon auriga TaxID=39042 RepID=UPI004032EA5B